ncbi:hypothetical protein QZH45_04740 [Pseudomonas corrugata]|uniref:hypothetical protein n=1 Tax=Pseudomonas corrugata TaxID=47879 RepID=UPI001428B5EA|nr:hypothetical protein [Pseudomonas corrugata]
MKHLDASVVDWRVEKANVACQQCLRCKWVSAIFRVHEIVLQNEDSKKSIGVDWLRRLANAGLFVARDLAGQQKLGWNVLAHAVFLFTLGRQRPTIGSR